MNLWTIQIPAPVALAMVAALGYLVVRRRKAANTALAEQSHRELRKAQSVATELERIAGTIRGSLAKHHASLTRFKECVGKLDLQQEQAAWKDLCREAEEILSPTLRLATQMAEAYDQIRQQSAHLMTFTELRTDPLTGLSNRRALDDSLADHFALMSRYDTQFSLAFFDIDHFKQVNDEHGHLWGDRVLQDVARLFDEGVRETDFVARYGGEEFVVIMPQTELDGASILAERLRVKIQQRLPLTVSGGVASALDGDTPESLMARADQALYGAKSAGRNCLFRHNGVQVEAIVETDTPAGASSAG